MNLRKNIKGKSVRRLSVPLPHNIHYELKKHVLDRRVTLSAWLVEAMIDTMIEQKKKMQKKIIKDEALLEALVQTQDELPPEE